MAKGPYLPNLEPFIAAGIDPKTNLPRKMVAGNPCMLKENIKRILRINDEQIAVNRFNWYNLPDGLDGHLIERILYYKGHGMFFYDENTDKYYFLPYTLDGQIDVYGRYTGVNPLPFNGNVQTEKDSKSWITSLKKVPRYDIKMDNMDYQYLIDSAVLLNDYTQQISQTILPRQMLNEGIIDVESEMIPFLRTALQNSTGIQGMRVGGQDEESNVLMANRSINDAALRGDKYIPIVGSVDFQSLTDGGLGRSDDFLMSMQALDNFRLGTFGVDNGGLWSKKTYQTNSQSAMNTGTVSPIMQDGVKNRQQFCNIVNSIYGLGIWCEPSESMNDIDMNMDGLAIDETSDQQPELTTMEVEE